MGSQRVLKAFLFTDLVDATALKTRVGDAAGAAAIAKHDTLFRECLLRYDGQEHENPGDGFFASFSLPSNALHCAIAFQQGLATLDLPEPLRARVGIHMGESVRVAGRDEADPAGKLLGLAVDISARVMGLAQAGQILLTRHAFDSVRQQVISAPDGTLIEWLAHGPYEFKGLDEPMEIFEAGLRGISPLTPPPDSPKARRALEPGEETTLGWRPAAGQPIPGRESWVLERQIGQGGFGEVWVARHAETHDQRVFKFCFEAEQLLSLQRELKLFRLMKEALGDRPDIVHLYEVHLKEAPYYLELEYAAGNLADWAAGQGGIETVPLETRLELVAQVAQALAAAHSIGIIHKDVKPANILIHEERDGRLQVRLADFGIGELLRKDQLTDAGITTTIFEHQTPSTPSQYSNLAGTQLYIAPELLAGQPSSIQSDVYALGVLLFQMVSGTLRCPIAHGWEQHIDDELLREDIAACVAGNPADRLSTADALARRLRSLPQRRTERQAQQSRAASEARRHRLFRIVSAAAIILLVLAGVTGVGLWRTEQALRREAAAKELAHQQAERARAAASKAQAALDFLHDMLASANPINTRGAELTVRQMLDEAAARVADYGDEPLVLATIEYTLGRTYSALGVLDSAATHASAALEAYRAALGENHQDTLQAAASLGLIYTEQGQFEQAEEILRDTLARQERTLGEEHEDTVLTMESLVELLLPQERHDDTEQFYRRLLDVRRRTLGPDAPLTFQAANNLAAFLRILHRHKEAEQIFRETHEGQCHALGNDHPQTLMTLNNLAGSLKDQKRFEQAEQLYRQALTELRRVQGPKHPTTLGAINNLATVLMDLERYNEAEPLLREALAILTEAIGPQHPTTLVATNNLARLLYLDGRTDEALALFEPLLPAAEQALPAQHVYLAIFRGTYGECLTAAGRYAEAEPLLLAALEGVVSYYGEGSPAEHSALTRLVTLYEKWEKPERAAEYQARLIATTQPDKPSADR